MITPQAEADILKRLLKKQGPKKFSAEELAGKAHWRWNRGELLEAAVLFDAATQRSAEEMRASPRKRDNTFNYRVRAGVTFRLAGETERAWPLLLEATTFDWNAAGIYEDRHITEWAFVEMLCVHAERNDTESFRRLFWQATARGESLDYPFPSIQPKQELLFDLCERLELVDELTHVIARIEAQRGKLTSKFARRLDSLKKAQLEHQH